MDERKTLSLGLSVTIPYHHNQEQPASQSVPPDSLQDAQDIDKEVDEVQVEVDGG